MVSAHRPTPDSVTTINADGSRYFLYPADVRGPFTAWRRISAGLLIAVYLLLPWIPVNGHPAVFLDIAGRRFHFLGCTLAAQDVWLLFFGVSGLGFGLFFLTALFGRVWCGWACPQTVFLDHVYRRIERWLEGDALARRALKLAPMSAGKLLRRALKHLLYVLASLVITHLFLAYFVSLPEVWSMMHDAPGEHWTAFLFVFTAAGLLYFNFAWFREQLCIVICPYGRLQSALTDDHSIVIGYDARRGEPRGKLKTEDKGRKTEDRTAHAASLSAHTSPASVPGSLSSGAAGDCVDCNRCVQVCPTGIDIRHGLQLECIGCAACIDACDEVMARVHRPAGLIRYDSFAGLMGGVTRWVRPHTVLYGVLLGVGAAVAAFAFSTVKPANFLVYRAGGAAYFAGPHEVRNQFMVRLVNKRTAPAVFTVSTEGLPAGLRQSGFETPVTLAPMGETVSPLVLVAPRRDYHGSFKFTVRVRDAARTFTLAREVEFMGPDARLLEEEDHAKGLKR
ncbi:MAG: cytochrome c oxidase accessory protein CcoG [Opitutae bacterium]|nr:cytochrome c oxidase accessory protein CcoG [Opitutae bacterium]